MSRFHLPPATIITTTDSLKSHVDRWQHEDLLAIDTESNSLHAYQEQVCLIQLSTRETDFIIDPLMVENLDSLGDLVADSGIEIIFHAAEYDLMCLKRDFGFAFTHLFDTMLAARVCGAKKLGLASMLEEHFGVKANKKYQRANWGERPLTAEMLHYAQLDTHYLPELRTYWHSQLADMGRLEEAQEIFRELCATPAAEHHFDPDGFWRINGMHHLEPRQIAILQALYEYREDTARRRDYPPFKIMGDKTLLALAEAEPGRMDQLRGIRGMSSGQIRRYGRGILNAVRQGQQAKPPRRPPAPPRPDDDIVARYEALHNWRKNRARQRGVESDVIVSKDAMWALARVAPSSPAELDRIRELGPWKTETYGQEILKVIAHANANGHHKR
jgi:ribonuclease D